MICGGIGRGTVDDPAGTNIESMRWEVCHDRRVAEDAIGDDVVSTRVEPSDDLSFERNVRVTDNSSETVIFVSVK